MTQRRLFLLIACVLGGLSVALGAFAAHGLKSRLTPDLLSVFEVGVRYQMYHALALLAVCGLGRELWNDPWTARAGWAWVLGVVLFSGSLYCLALSGMPMLGAITPFGGVLFIAGWCFLAAAAIKSRFE